jgi:hypothetical protein
MREFARSETMLEKCHYCGCKNKLYTDIIDNLNNVVGHTLRCCNCGRTVTFIYPQFTQTTSLDYINHKLHAGSQKCIRESYCPHTNCGLYNTCPQNPEKTETSSCGCDNECDFQYQCELKVKALNEPKFL